MVLENLKGIKMSILSQPTQHKVLPVNTNGNIAALLSADQNTPLTEHNGKILHIANLLQTTLDVDEILSIFSKEIHSTILHDNLSFVHEQRNINVVLGKRARHSCTYELTIKEDHLGFISFTRKSKFSNADIEMLENMICAVHYPLRNALLYTEAISAAHKDPLTGVGNRGSMNDSIHREMELASRHNRSLGIIMLDIDHFKSINDSYGHAAGDVLLQTLVECAEKSVRISDMMFRYGGEEFVILLPETDEAGVLRLAKRIRRRVEKLETTIQSQVIKLTVSIGVTTLNNTDDDKSLVARADEALYRAKREGRNCIRIADPV